MDWVVKIFYLNSVIGLTLLFINRHHKIRLFSYPEFWLINHSHFIGHH